MPETTVQNDVGGRIARAVGLPLESQDGVQGRVLHTLGTLEDLGKAAAGGQTGLYFTGAGAGREIMVPLDGTAAAEAILPFVIRIAQESGTPVRLFVRKGTPCNLLDVPIERYQRVLVNTMKEQHVNVSGTVTTDDVLTAAATAARPVEGIVALASRGTQGPGCALSDARLRASLQGLPVLYCRQ